MERLIVVVCGEAGRSTDVEKDLLRSVQRAVPSCTESDFREVLGKVHRVVTAPTPETLEVAKVLFQYAKEVAVDESAVEDGRIDAFQPIETNEWGSKLVPYYEENSLSYDYNTPPGKFVFGVVGSRYFSRCVESHPTKRLLRVDFTATEEVSCSRYAEDVENAKLQVAVRRKLREVEARCATFLAETVHSALASLIKSCRRVTVPQTQADPAVTAFRSIDFTADFEAIAASYDCAQSLISSFPRWN